VALSTISSVSSFASTYSSASGLGLTRGRNSVHARATQLLPAAADRAERLGEHDLEVGELGVDVVVGLGALGLHLGAGLGQDPVGLVLGAPHDLGVGDQRAALVVGTADDLVGLGLRVGDHLLVVGDHRLGVGQLGGQCFAELAEHADQLGPVDHAGGRHRHRAGAFHRRGDLVEFLLHVHGRLSLSVCRPVPAEAIPGGSAAPRGRTTDCTATGAAAHNVPGPRAGRARGGG
jgi:hypothetical protein